MADEHVLNFELGERLTPHSKESDDEYEAFYGGAHVPDQIDGATETLWAQLTIAQQQGACPDQIELTKAEQSNGFPALAQQAFRGLDSCEPMPLRRLLCSLAKLPSAPAAAILREAIEARAEMSACIGLVLASADLEIGRNLATANYEELVGLISHREWNTRLAGGEVFAALIPAPLVGKADGQAAATGGAKAQAVVQAGGEVDGVLETTGYKAGVSRALASVIENYDMSCRWIAVASLERLVHAWRLRGDVDEPPATIEASEAAYDAPGSEHVVREFRARVAHHQPGTQWMAIKALAIFGRATDGASFVTLLEYFNDGSMPAHGGFPGTGIAALESLLHLYSHGPLAPRLAAALATSLTSSHDLVQLLALEGLHRLGALAEAPPPPVELASLAGHADAEVRLLVALALGGFAQSSAGGSSAGLLRKLGGDTARDVRCAAAKALAMATQRANGWSRHLPPPAGDDCDDGVDIKAARAAYLRGAAADSTRLEELEERYVAEPMRTIRQLRLGTFGEAATRLTLLYLEGPSAVAPGLDPSGLLTWNVRWHALLALRFMTMRGRAASWARSQALRLLQREPSDERFDAVGGRYMGLKALGLLTVAASRESIAAFASALNDRSDAIRFGAGELLVATLPRISIGARCSLKEHAAEAHTPPDAACESYMLKHDEEAVRRRSPMGFHSDGFNAASDSIQSWQLGVSAILRQFASRDTYTRFAAGVALRRVAAGCATGHVVGGSILARVEAALVGQHTMDSSQLSHAAKSVAAALSQCELIGRTKPQRTRWWLQEPYACVRGLSSLSEPEIHAVERRFGGVNCSLEDEARASESGALLLRQAVAPEVVALEERRYRASRAFSRTMGGSSGRIYCGMLTSPSQFEDRLRATLQEIVDRQTANGFLFSRNPKAHERAVKLQSSEFVGLERALQEQKCRPDESGKLRCSVDWHMDGDFDYGKGQRADKLWMLVHRDGARHQSNIVILPRDSLEKACDAASEGADLVAFQGHLNLGVLDRLSCALEVEPGDVLVFWGDTMHRTQDMEAETRSALSVELF